VTDRLLSAAELISDMLLATGGRRSYRRDMLDVPERPVDYEGAHLLSPEDVR
jgi:hypothetical protein